MPLLAKVDYEAASVSTGRIRIHARAYRQPQTTNGDRVYIWRSESSGGKGLESRGSLVRSAVERFPNKTGSGNHEELALTVELDGRTPNRSLSLVQIGQYRDRGSPYPLGELSSLLYEHQHNKIVSVNQNVAGFLDTFFEG